MHPHPRTTLPPLPTPPNHLLSSEPARWLTDITYNYTRSLASSTTHRVNPLSSTRDRWAALTLSPETDAKPERPSRHRRCAVRTRYNRIKLRLGRFDIRQTKTESRETNPSRRSPRGKQAHSPAPAHHHPHRHCAALYFSSPPRTNIAALTPPTATRLLSTIPPTPRPSPSCNIVDSGPHPFGYLPDLMW